MKKVFAVVAIAAGLVACGGSNTTQTTSDSTATAVDTVVATQDTTAVKADSTVAK